MISSELHVENGLKEWKERNGTNELGVYCNDPARNDCGLDQGVAVVRVVGSGQILDVEGRIMGFVNGLGVRAGKNR